MSTYGGSEGGETQGYPGSTGPTGPGAPGGPQPPPPQYPPPPPYYGGSAVRIPNVRLRPRREYPIETKPFFLTSEFAAFLIATIALIISAAADNSIDSRFFWTIEVVILSAYLLSRGIAKAGTKSRSADPREDVLRNRSDPTHQS